MCPSFLKVHGHDVDSKICEAQITACNSIFASCVEHTKICFEVTLCIKKSYATCKKYYTLLKNVQTITNGCTCPLSVSIGECWVPHLRVGQNSDDGLGWLNIFHFVGKRKGEKLINRQSTHGRTTAPCDWGSCQWIHVCFNDLVITAQTVRPVGQPLPAGPPPSLR